MPEKKRRIRPYLKMEKESTTLEEGRKKGLYRKSLKGASKETVDEMARQSRKKTYEKIIKSLKQFFGLSDDEVKKLKKKAK